MIDYIILIEDDYFDDDVREKYIIYRETEKPETTAHVPGAETTSTRSRSSIF